MLYLFYISRDKFTVLLRSESDLNIYERALTYLRKEVLITPQHCVNYLYGEIQNYKQRFLL